MRRISTTWPWRWGARRRVLHFVERQHEPLDRFLGGRDLARRHLGEVFFLQHLAVGDGQPHIGFELRRFALGLAAAREQGLLHALSAGRRLLILRSRRGRQHGREQLVDAAAAAKENAEGLVEQDRVLVAFHEHRMQHPIEILAGADAGSLDRRERVQHRTGADRDAGSTQRAGEVDDIVCELPALLRRHSAARNCART